MRVNPFTAVFAEIGQYFRKSTTDKNQALKDFSIPKYVKSRERLSDSTLQELSDTEADPVGKEKIAARSYSFAERRVPKVQLLDSAASAFRVHNDLKFLRTQKNRLPIADNLSLKSSFLDRQINSFLTISNKLLNLRESVKILRQREIFNIKRAKSSNPDVLTASTTAKSPTGNFQVKVSQLADGQWLVSDVVSDPFASLGYSGTVQINGFDIIIEESDSLEDIKNQINFGEDSNRNGILDLGEDLNNDGRLEILVVKSTPFAKGIVIVEDINGDNVIQGSEDLDNDGILEGGIADHKVIAFISNDRLYLNSLSKDNRKISLQDDNNIYLNLGFFELNRFNAPVLKEQQLDPDTFENLNKAPTFSSLTVNGDSFEKEVNYVSDIIPETTLSLKDTSSRNISLSISLDMSAAIASIKNFVTVYNDTIQFLNRELAFSRVLEENDAVQKIRNGLNDKVEDDVLNADPKFNNLQEIGITGQNQEKNTFNEITIKNLVANLKKGIPDSLSFPTKGSHSVFGGLNKIGIRTLEDDTLVIDERELKKILKSNSEEVTDFFTDSSSGMAEKLSSLLDIWTDQQGGPILLQMNKISSLKNDSSFATELAMKSANVDAAQFNKSVNESVLVSVKV